jgi:hypothetical protein
MLIALLMPYLVLAASPAVNDPDGLLCSGSGRLQLMSAR